jgi:hypothetical protein
VQDDSVRFHGGAFYQFELNTIWDDSVMVDHHEMIPRCRFLRIHMVCISRCVHRRKRSVY